MSVHVVGKGAGVLMPDKALHDDEKSTKGLVPEFAKGLIKWEWRGKGADRKRQWMARLGLKAPWQNVASAAAATAFVTQHVVLLGRLQELAIDGQGPAKKPCLDSSKVEAGSGDGVHRSIAKPIMGMMQTPSATLAGLASTTVSVHEPPADLTKAITAGSFCFKALGGTLELPPATTGGTSPKAPSMARNSSISGSRAPALPALQHLLEQKQARGADHHPHGQEVVMAEAEFNNTNHRLCACQPPAPAQLRPQSACAVPRLPPHHLREFLLEEAFEADLDAANQGLLDALTTPLLSALGRAPSGQEKEHDDDEEEKEEEEEGLFGAELAQLLHQRLDKHPGCPRLEQLLWASEAATA